jgi:hypothetical protein
VTDLAFASDALDAKRSGQLTPEQAETIRNSIDEANENYSAAHEEHAKIAKAEALAQIGGVAQAFERAVPEDAASLDMHSDTATGLTSRAAGRSTPRDICTPM